MYKIHPDQPAVSNGLLSYEIRPSVTQFFEQYIYGNIEKIISETWDNFIVAFPENDEQDIYYLFHAVNRIKLMIADKYGEESDKLQAFETYVLEKVKLILNIVEKDTNCEEIFSNLNGNKVELTGAELIKGLILTTIARDHNAERRMTYREITEIRAVIGRQWDEIAHWSNRDDIRSFFFQDHMDENAMNNLLYLLALNMGYNPSGTARTALFNYFEARIKKSNKASKIASDYFSALRELQHILDEWFNDTTIYNKIGYLLFSKGSKDSIQDFMDMLKKDKSRVRDALGKDVLSRLNFEIDRLEYDNDKNIYNLLFAINVFCYDNSRFDFQKFNLGKWSLEHIFPQNPEGLPEILGPEDIKLIKALAGDDLDSYEKVSALLVEEDIEDTEVFYNNLKGKIAAHEGGMEIDEKEKQLLYRIIKTDDFSKQKIIWGNLNLRASFALAPEKIFVNAPATMIVPGDKFILGILNSKLADYYIRNLGVTRNGGYFEYKPMFISQMPIPDSKSNDRKNIELLVTEIIRLKEQNKEISVLDIELNFSIYRLYSLSEKETDFINSL
jgi:hypothetical protein